MEDNREEVEGSASTFEDYSTQATDLKEGKADRSEPKPGAEDYQAHSGTGGSLDRMTGGGFVDVTEDSRQTTTRAEAEEPPLYRDLAEEANATNHADNLEVVERPFGEDGAPEAVLQEVGTPLLSRGK